MSHASRGNGSYMEYHKLFSKQDTHMIKLHEQISSGDEETTRGASVLRSRRGPQLSVTRISTVGRTHSSNEGELDMKHVTRQQSLIQTHFN